MFDHIFKHQEESRKYDAQQSIFGSFKVSANVVKHCPEYLIYLPNRNQN